jgi:hypothetical protein
MATREQFSNIKFFPAFTAQNMLASGDITGDDIDTQGYEAVTFGFVAGNLSAITSVSYIQLVLQHADASTAGGAGTYANVSATDVIGPSTDVTSLTSGVWKKLFTSGAAALSDLGSQVYTVGYRGTKRYVRMYVDLVDSVGAASDAIAGFAALGLPADWPVVERYDVSTSEG